MIKCAAPDENATSSIDFSLFRDLLALRYRSYAAVPVARALANV